MLESRFTSTMVVIDTRIDAVAKEAPAGGSGLNKTSGARRAPPSRPVNDDDDDRRYGGEGIDADDDDY